MIDQQLLSDGVFNVMTETGVSSMTREQVLTILSFYLLDYSVDMAGSIVSYNTPEEKKAELNSLLVANDKEGLKKFVSTYLDINQVATVTLNEIKKKLIEYANNA